MSARRFKRYPEYKDSGVEWLGQTPAHWRHERLKYGVSKIGSGKTPSGGADVYQNSGVMLIRSQNVHFDGLRLDDVAFIDAATDASMANSRVVDGDVLLNITGASLGRCCVARIGSAHANVNQHVCAIRPRKGTFDPFFLSGCLSSNAGQAQVFESENGISRDALTFHQIGDIVACSPPLDEQRSIVAFLGRETARIDALVAKKEYLIELLQEKRTALITRAVTKGLNPNVPLKDSGVEWIGEIPAHWSIERIKWAARMESGHTPDKKVEAYWQGGAIPWISLSDTGRLRKVDHIADTAVKTTPEGIANSSAHVLPIGTVVFSRDATIGLCAITRSEMAVSQHFIGWVCGPRLRPEYLLFVLRSMTWELDRRTMGATVRTIGMTDVRSLVTPIPPIHEQERIIHDVLRRRAQIDAILSKVSEAIDRLRELRTALISAAVTGKIDVREGVA